MDHLETHRFTASRSASCNNIPSFLSFAVPLLMMTNYNETYLITITMAMNRPWFSIFSILLTNDSLSSAWIIWTWSTITVVNHFQASVMHHQALLKFWRLPIIVNHQQPSSTLKTTITNHLEPVSIITNSALPRAINRMDLPGRAAPTSDMSDLPAATPHPQAAHPSRAQTQPVAVATSFSTD